MVMDGRAARADEVTRLARGAADWLPVASLTRRIPSLYHGQAGVVLALQEAFEHFGDERYGRAVAEGRDALIEHVESLEDCSLSTW